MILALLFPLLSLAANPLQQMAAELKSAEKAVPGLVKGTEARCDFANSADPAPTRRAFLYLHGFSASPVESYPLTENLAAKEKANSCFARYTGHGIEGPEGLRGATADHWAEDTRKALARARMAGKKVVVIATSTGAPLVLTELLRDQEGVEALILQSPNFGLKDKSSELLLLPYPVAWLLGAVVMGPYRSFEPLTPRQAIWWTTRYPFTAVLEMMRAVEKFRSARLEELKVPVLVLYSGRDHVVSLDKMREAFSRFGSGKKEMREMKLSENEHVLAGSILSPSGTAEAEGLIENFLRKLSGP